jgi:hypothetical protein
MKGPARRTARHRRHHRDDLRPSGENGGKHEAGRQDANDVEGRRTERNRTPDDTLIAAESLFPCGVRQYSRPAPVLDVERLEQPAACRCDTEDVKVIGRDSDRRDGIGSVVGRHNQASAGQQSNAAQPSVLAVNRLKKLVRNGRPPRPGLTVHHLQNEHALGVSERKRPEKDGIGDAEDCGVGSNRERQSRHRHHRESRRVPDISPSELQIVEHRLLPTSYFLLLTLYRTTGRG